MARPFISLRQNVALTRISDDRGEAVLPTWGRKRRSDRPATMRLWWSRTRLLSYAERQIDLRELLASAPLEGVVPERDRDYGREVGL
jgi:hypothetical protein